MGAVNKSTGKKEMWNECFLHSDDDTVNAQLEQLPVWEEHSRDQWMSRMDNRRKIDETKSMEIFYLKEGEQCREVMS